jgi:predicted metalloprotease with PDZ domain
MRSLLDSQSTALFAILWCLVIGGFNCAEPSGPDKPHLSIHVDLSRAQQGIFRASIQIPCNGRELTLHYPKWIPGEHSPNGPIMQLTNVRFSVHGKAVSWERDMDDMFTFHCTVPEKSSVLDVSLDYLSPSTISGPGYGYSPNNTAHLLALLWYSVLLYPEAESTDNVRCDASLRLPAGWTMATSLPVRAQGNDTVAFEEVSLTRLIDSPVMAGEFVRSIPLSEDNNAPVTLHLIGDSPEALAIDSSQVISCRNVVQEVDSLFGVRHFNTYHMLVSLSDLLVADGVEHHESTDIRLPEREFLDEKVWKRRSYLIPHEYIHSWNGKYRRPLGLMFSDYQHPVETDLLWVYEGLTRYLDVVITGRSGLRTPDEVREYFAWAGGYLDRTRPGRSWRSLHDASVSAQLLYDAPEEWTAWRRGPVDIYDEGALLWLEADATIRDLSEGQRSLDDFCKEFFGGKAAPLTVKDYSLDDLVKALDHIAHYDWQAFISSRVDSLTPHPPLGGLSLAGWELVYTDTPNLSIALRESLEYKIDATWSIGASIFANGLVQDVVPGSPAFQAGIAPGMKVSQVDGKGWSIDGARAALARAKRSGTGIDLVLQHGKVMANRHLEYQDGEKYPHLRRIEGKDDVLERIIEPRSIKREGRGGRG